MTQFLKLETEFWTLKITILVAEKEGQDTLKKLKAADWAEKSVARYYLAINKNRQKNIREKP